MATTGPVSYRVLLEDGRVWRRHQDHMRQRWEKTEPPITPLVTVSDSDVVSDNETGTDNVPSVSDRGTAPVESAETGSSSSEQQSSLTTSQCILS